MFWQEDISHCYKVRVIAPLLRPYVSGSTEEVQEANVHAGLQAAPVYSDWQCRNILKRAVVNADFSVTFLFINGEKITELLDKDRYGNSSKKTEYQSRV